MTNTWRVNSKTEMFVVGVEPLLYVHLVLEGRTFAMRPTREEFASFQVGDEVVVTVTKRAAE